MRKKIKPYFYAPGQCTLLVLLCISFNNAYTQRGNTWYFGQSAGLDFNSGSPKALTNGALYTFEGCASISDEKGRLLFYTDGKTVYNRLHQPMPNGKNLLGNVSSFQSSVIVPQPGSSTIFYLFTSDALETQGESGYAYSEINMTLNNGLGDISATKNIVLSAPSSERLCVAKAANYIDWWIITNEWSTNTFRAYKVDCNGVNSTPVVSTVGRVLNDNDYDNIGAMKVSPDNRLLCQTNNKGRLNSNIGNEFAQLFDFDNNSGRITNAREIPLVSDGYYMGCEFSPDSRLLYLLNPRSSVIHQFDVSSGNIATIIGSKYIIPASNTFLSGIQMAPDLKLYLTSNGKYLHVINQPNTAGAGCNFVQNQADLASGKSILALPNFPTGFFVNRAVDFTYVITDSCTGTVQFTSDIKLTGVSFSWDFGDGTTSTTPNPVHTFSNKNKQYPVSLTIQNDLGCVNETSLKYINPAGKSIEIKFTVKADCKSRSVDFKDSAIADINGLQYNWDFGDGTTANGRNPTHQYLLPGKYAVRLIANTGNSCLADTFTSVIDLTAPIVDAGSDLVITSITPQQLKVTGAQTYVWTPPTYLDDATSAAPTVTAYDDIQYIIHGYSSAGCEGTDTLNITVLKGTVVEVPNAFIPGSNSANQLLRPLLRRINKLYYFIVYNRLGQKVFETNTIGEGWNGKLNGKIQAGAVYVWTLKVEDANGKIIAKKGTSILIR